MSKEYTVRDPVVLVAHQFYLNKLIPAMQEVIKDWDLRVCEGIMTCIVVYQGKLMLAGYSWESPRPGYSTRPMPKMFNKQRKFQGTVTGNMVKTGPVKQLRDPEFYPLSEEDYQTAVEEKAHRHS